MANVTVVEDGLVEMRKKVFQLMRGTEFTAVVFNEVNTSIATVLQEQESRLYYDVHVAVYCMLLHTRLG